MNIKTIEKYEKEFNNPYSFPLDDFQKNAIDIINSTQPHNILVTAHTGSGKSLVAEHAIITNFKNNKKTLYTSPIKSLSNQKFYEFKNKFKDLGIDIGLLTGDHKCNPQANCIILTTEILLNILNFKYIDHKELLSENSVFDIDLDDVQTVIFDEVHYINDQDRGGVWEQCIMKLPNTINQILLSATINKPDEFALWINSCNGLPTYILPNFKRVVPLYFNIFFTLVPSIIKKINNGIHIKDKTKDILTAEQLKEHGKLVNKLIPIKNTIDNKVDLNEYLKIEKLHKHFMATNKDKPSYISDICIINNTVSYLKDNNMMPCLFFVLSRNKIHYYINQFNMTLNSTEEQSQVMKEFDFYIRKLNGDYHTVQCIEEIKNIAVKGFAIHHSGMLPILKEIIELLYAKNLIKVLFATETFSVGLNMPTKTVIFTSINKFSGLGFRNLYPHEFIQMAGRAGRRGMDDKGFVIYLPQLEKKDFTDSISLKNLLVSKPPAIKSKYSIEPLYILKSLIRKIDPIEDIKKTMWYTEQLFLKNQREYEYNKLLEFKEYDVDTIDNLSDNTKNLLYEYMETISKKRIKDIENSITDFDMIYDKWIKFIKYSNKLNKLKDSDIIQDNINVCLNFLKKFKFIDHDNNLTQLGNSVKYLGDNGNILLLAIIVNDPEFINTNNYEMISILSIFCDENNGDDFITKQSDFYNKLTLINNDMIDELNKYSIYVSKDWEINFTNFDIVNKWINNDSFNNIQKIYPIYEGNFVKNMIKLSNIVKSCIVFFKAIGNINLVEKFANFDNIINRDIVSCESVYLNI